MIKAKYVIIGNSAGGIGAAEAIREVDKTGAIAIVSDEPYPAYSRPMISDHLAEGCELERMLYRPRDFYERNAIQLFLGRKAVHLDSDQLTVKLDDGQEIIAEKLLLATGGTPIVPPMDGLERRGVFTFTTLDDAKAISEFLGGGARRAVVIGGGLIGISASEALVKRGLAVSIIELKNRVLNVMLDAEASALEEAALQDAGVSIITGRTVAKINGGPAPDSNVSSVTLDDGSEILADLVVVAIGVRPRIELLSGTAVKTDRGILVDRRMATSVPGIYACGDAAEAYDFTCDASRLTPIWPNAYLGGRIAGLNMAGSRAEYPGGTAMNSLKYFGVDIVSAGLVMPPADSYETVSRKSGDALRKIILKDGVIVGMEFAIDIDKAGIIFGLMRDRVNADAFKEALVAADFSLAALPEEIQRTRLEAKPAGIAPVAIADEPAEEMVVDG